MTMDITRRRLLKAHAAALAASTVGVPLVAGAQPVPGGVRKVFVDCGK